MNFPSKTTDAKLEALRDREGFDNVEQMLEAAVFDSVSPGIRRGRTRPELRLVRELRRQ